MGHSCSRASREGRDERRQRDHESAQSGCARRRRHSAVSLFPRRSLASGGRGRAGQRSGRRVSTGPRGPLNVEQLVAGNRLLQALPASLRPGMQLATRVELRFGEVLCEAGKEFTDVYFPIGCSISVLVPIDRHPPMELGLIGREGMLGATLALGSGSCPWLAVVQGDGSALRLTIKQCRALQRRSPSWERVLRRFAYLQIVQQSRITACSHYHRLDERLARWLLMSLDRTSQATLPFSHRFLADMLGVQRSAVTLAAGVLQRAGLIRYARGSIEVLDRRRLLSRACSCYQTLLDDDARVFPS